MANRLAEIVWHQAQKYGEREAYRFCWHKEGEWISTSWKEFENQVECASKSLALFGLIEKDTIAICSPNTPQILITEIGAFRNRIAAIPIYASSSQEQFDFIVNRGEAKVLFVGNSQQYPLAYSYSKRNPNKVSKIFIFKNDGFSL